MYSDFLGVLFHYSLQRNSKLGLAASTDALGREGLRVRGLGIEPTNGIKTQTDTEPAANEGNPHNAQLHKLTKEANQRNLTPEPTCEKIVTSRATLKTQYPITLDPKR